MRKKISVVFSLIAVLFLLILNTMPAFAETQVFDTVLVLDVSGSMSSSISSMKSSAISFCRDILSLNSENQIAVVSFATNAYQVCSMTNDISELQGAINGLSSGGLTNMYDAIRLADGILESAPHSFKNVIIMADGYPCEGYTADSGRYTAKYPNDLDLVQYCNPIYDYVSKNLHPIANVYTVGFFNFNTQNISDENSDYKLVVEFMNDLANARSYYPTDAEEMFSEVASDVIATTTQVVTAAPVTTAPPVTTAAPTATAVSTTTMPATAAKPVAATPKTTVPVEKGTTLLFGSASGSTGSMSTGTVIAIGSGATIGIGGLIALIIFLTTRKPITPIPPVIIPPVVLPVEDEEDEEKEQYAYAAPSGIDVFAGEMGAVGNGLPVVAFATLCGISGEYKSASIPVHDGERISIGRDPKQNHLVISKDEQRVSRVHCEISYRADVNRFVVTDLSRNGTYANGEKLPFRIPTEVPEGTQIRLANSNHVFKLG